MTDSKSIAFSSNTSFTLRLLGQEFVGQSWNLADKPEHFTDGWTWFCQIPLLLSKNSDYLPLFPFAILVSCVCVFVEILSFVCFPIFNQSLSLKQFNANSRVLTHLVLFFFLSMLNFFIFHLFFFNDIMHGLWKSILDWI